MTNSKKLSDLLLRRKHVLVVPKNSKTTKAKKTVFLTELVSLGYEPTDVHKFDDSILDNHKDIIKSLKKLKAGHVDYVPLFTGFPDKVPNEDEYLSLRIYGFMGNVIGLFTNGHKLENGLIVPEWLFDLAEFGADPITQFQDKALYDKVLQNQKSREEDTTKSLSKVRFVTQNEAWEIGKFYLNDILSAKSSIKETLKKDIEFLLQCYGTDNINVDNISFRETKTYIQKYFWDKNDVQSACNLVTTSTDFLRLFAAITGSDVSLSEKIKFPKFNRKQRKAIIAALERLGQKTNLVQDLVRYRGLWLSVARGLHVGEFHKKYPLASAAFSSLRNEKILTWNSKVETKISSGKYDLELLKQRPNEFARRLHSVMRIAALNGNTEEVLSTFEKVAEQVPVKTLLVLSRYFRTINDLENRTVINKKGKIKIFKNKLPKFDHAIVVAHVIEQAISKRIYNKKTNNDWLGKKVWIDPSLTGFVVPLQQRKASDAFLTVGRGTRIKFDDKKTLRLFVWWKEQTIRTDLDLSLVQFDKNMNFKGQVSYTRLTDKGIVHSGDIQSAPNGAAEFIDVSLDVLKTKGVRYIAPQIYRFSGNSFVQMNECYAGWMLRDKVDNNYKSFDVKTVENAFNLNGNSAFALPMIVDLKTNEIIFVDLYVGTQLYGNRVENSLNSVSTIIQEIIKMGDTKPNMYDLTRYNIIGRDAKLVKERDEADLTVGITECDYNASEIESVLNEFLI